jgi:hypothetical protein
MQWLENYLQSTETLTERLNDVKYLTISATIHATGPKIHMEINKVKIYPATLEEYTTPDNTFTYLKADLPSKANCKAAHFNLTIYAPPFLLHTTDLNTRYKFQAFYHLNQQDDTTKWQLIRLEHFEQI